MRKIEKSLLYIIYILLALVIGLLVYALVLK